MIYHSPLPHLCMRFPHCGAHMKVEVSTAARFCSDSDGCCGEHNHTLRAETNPARPSLTLISNIDPHIRKNVFILGDDLDLSSAASYVTNV